jgi:hypothetical protein
LIPSDVRRQVFWHQELLKLRESSAHLVNGIMRRVSNVFRLILSRCFRMALSRPK